MKNTITTMQQAKNQGRKLTMLTAYDYSTAKLMDEAGIESILVGDSLGMTMLGFDDTLPVTMEHMLHHTKAVTRAAKNALVVADMPYLSYHLSVEQAVQNAGRLIKEGGAQAVKLEGGAQFADVIRGITRASIPVMGHLGLTPQSVNALGGFKVQGKSEAVARQILEDAKALQEVGVFSLVLECVPAKLAAMITQALSIPTIGIGSGVGCDGQVLVYQDMLGMYSPFTPKFVQQFAQVGALMKQGFQAYIKAVQDQSFPGEQHGFSIEDGVLEKL